MSRLNIDSNNNNNNNNNNINNKKQQLHNAWIKQLQQIVVLKFHISWTAINHELPKKKWKETYG